MECILVNFGRIPAVATTSGLAVDDGLGTQTYRGRVLELGKNVESVGECACRALSPA